MAARDSVRSAVYAAEDQVAARLARGSSTAEVFGSTLTLPAERRFADLASVQRYVDLVLALDGVRSRWPSLPTVTVRDRAGITKAHYESAGVIAIPIAAGWAGRELIVLHELAHHVVASSAPGVASHGPEFTATMCALVSTAMGPEVELLLRVAYDGVGVTVGTVA